ncbi:site-specific DNA-methyltransferase [Acidimicrobiia bacterium]|nr:site-specific DNA-methyltransferase [Acidimicrobiia bacterium]
MKNNLYTKNKKYLDEIFSSSEVKQFEKKFSQKNSTNLQDEIHFFNNLYESMIKSKFQKEYQNADKGLNNFLENKDENLKIIWGDCLTALRKMDSESIQLMVTSPPYYNARDYSQWKNIDEYLEDMKQIIKESWRVLDNHRVWVFNVGDIFGNPNNKTSSVWGKQRIPLGAYFTTIFEEEGFTFVDDFIWDKGEVQSQRQKNANNPYPMYQYPVNSYEHILIFHKHRLDTTKFPCPRCGSLNVNGNTQSEPGLQSWECKNNDCPERSASNRGKRFSLKTNMTQSSELRNLENKIDEDFVKKWRKDIIPFSPVIKINSKGENTLGHTAPFPEDIPEYAVRMFTYKGEKVLDPFAGSFTAPKVATKLGRIGIGVELNKKMFGKDIKKHLEKIDNSLFDHPTTWNEFSILKEKKVNRQK